MDSPRQSVEDASQRHLGCAPLSDGHPLPLVQLPRVAVVLVNWNGLQDTLECIESLRRTGYDRQHIIVVDNGSGDDQAKVVQNRFPEVQVHTTGQNLGFTGGNNLGIRLALAEGADYILCLNNDTTVAPDLLLRLVEAMEANPRAGIATAAIYEAHRPAGLAGLGCRLRFDLLLCGEHMRDPEAARSPEAFEVPYAEGCAMVMRSSVAERTGGFDDEFFAYLEDADLCLRAKALGWTSLAIPLARVWHKVDGKPSGSGSSVSYFYAARNSWRLVRRHATAAQRTTFYGCCPRRVLGVLRDLVHSRASDRRAYECQAALLLGTTAGFLGFKGRRNAGSWPTLEKGLRATLNTLVFLLSPLAPLLPRRHS